MWYKAAFCTIYQAMPYNPATLEKKIEHAIQQISFRDAPHSLFAPIEYVLSLGGKRVRPILTMLASDLFGGDVDASINAALGIEIFHNFSLLHDDVMDKADIRRGRPTVHKKWNDNVAILSGDAMLIGAYNFIARVPAEHLEEVLKLFSTTAMEVCRGQQFDMDFETRDDVDEAEYLEMIRLKTAVLIGCSLKVGAILANATAEDADLLYRFGVHIGLAFQLKDDLLDVYGNPEVFGKNIGGDIVSNKKTYILIKALRLADSNQQKELRHWLSKETFVADEKIKAVKSIYDALNLQMICNNLIERYYLEAMDCLSAINVADSRKKELIRYAENLMYREK